jgi:hypothetical protein
MANGSNMAFCNSTTMWAPLIEKAYAQLMEQSGVQVGSVLNQHGDSYADTAGGWGQSLTEITGQSYVSDYLYAGESAATNASLMSSFQTAFANHEEIIVGTSGNTVTDNLVASHMFNVIGVNAAAGMVELDNPWNGSGAGSSKAMQFWESITGLANDSATVFVTTGKPVH